MPMKLTGSQMGAFATALADAYSVGKLKMMLMFRLDKDLEDFAGDNRPEKLYDLVKTANMEGWVERLLEAARASNPGNAKLLAFQDSLNLASISAEVRPGLEKVVSERSHFVNIM